MSTPRRDRTGRARSLAAGALAVVCLSAAAAPAVAAPGGPSGAKAERWSPDLSSVGADDVNVHAVGGALKVHSRGFRTAAGGTRAGYGTEITAAHRLAAPANRVRADLDADVPSGAHLTLDVRGRDGDGRWTEWRTVENGSATLPQPVTQVQARLTLEDPAGTAAVHGLALSADNVAVPHVAATTTAAFSSTVYATREGLVGGTTANGHVITTSDHFVALPSGRGLSPAGSSQYSVQVCGPTRCETAPVWDVGPWNTHDDYWNPSSTRERYTDLAQGLPEAQAAYQSGYNGGLDGFGRTVSNPAGIDLADGTFYNVGLNDNGWVTVTYLWTGGGSGTTSWPTWGSGVNIRAQATTASSVVATLSGPTQVNIKCQVHGQTVTASGYTNDAWSYLPDYGGYISNIFIDDPNSWLPGVPTC